jgi:hypothetical protein
LQMATDNASKKKGLLGTIWQIMAGAKSCCASGETCCGPVSPAETNQDKTVKSLKTEETAHAERDNHAR